MPVDGEGVVRLALLGVPLMQLLQSSGDMGQAKHTCTAQRDACRSMQQEQRSKERGYLAKAAHCASG